MPIAHIRITASLSSTVRRFLDQLLAASIAILVNIAAIWLLASAMQQSPSAGEAGESEAAEVVWIARISKTAPDRPEPATKKGNVPGFQPRTRERSNHRLTIKESSPIALAPVPYAAGDDQWGQDTSSTASGFAGERFRRDPLARRDEPLEATQNRMDLTFADSSLGGVLQRMTERGICGDLRRALTSEPGSAEAILETMRKHDCPH